MLSVVFTYLSTLISETGYLFIVLVRYSLLFTSARHFELWCK